MNKILRYVLLICVCCNVYARSPTLPSHTIKTEHFITSIALYENMLFVSTSDGIIELWDIRTRKQIHQITLENISDYFGNAIASKIFHTHTIDGENLLIISQDSNGSSKISIHNAKSQTLSKIHLPQEYTIIKKAYFIDKNTLVVGFLSNEILAFDMKTNTTLWKVKPSDAVFSDLIINGNIALSSTEGGVIYVIDVKSGKILSALKGANFDNINMLASAKNIVISAGTDKNCGIYNINTKNFMRLKTNFLAYAAGISQDSSRGAVSVNENNEILVFSTLDSSDIALLSGGDALPNSIIFIDNENIIASFDSRSILFWTLGE